MFISWMKQNKAIVKVHINQAAAWTFLESRIWHRPWHVVVFKKASRIFRTSLIPISCYRDLSYCFWRFTTGVSCIVYRLVQQFNKFAFAAPVHYSENSGSTRGRQNGMCDKMQPSLTNEQMEATLAFGQIMNDAVFFSSLCNSIKGNCQHHFPNVFVVKQHSAQVKITTHGIHFF